MFIVSCEGLASSQNPFVESIHRWNHPLEHLKANRITVRSAERPCESTRHARRAMPLARIADIFCGSDRRDKPPMRGNFLSS